MRKSSVLICGVVISGLALICGCGKQNAGGSNITKTEALKVRTASAAEHLFRRQINVQGAIQPLDSAAISARVNGTIESLSVREGVRVKKGDVLFQTDRVNLENQVTVAKQTLRVADETCATVRMDVEIAKTNLEKAVLDHNRSKTLYASKAVSASNFESAEVAWKNARRMLEKAQVVLKYTQVKVEQARTNLEIAEKNLTDSIIRAPYDGVITARHLESGEFAAVGTPVLELENQENLEISARISAIYHAGLSMKTAIVLKFNGRALCRTTLSYISPSIDPLSRTFEIKANLPKNMKLVSGTLCDVTIILAERKGWGLPTDAVLARANGKFAVFAVENGKAKEIPVIPGFSTNNFTEILNANELRGRKTVVSGQYFLNDGAAVQIVNGK